MIASRARMIVLGVCTLCTTAASFCYVGLGSSAASTCTPDIRGLQNDPNAYCLTDGFGVCNCWCNAGFWQAATTNPSASQCIPRPTGVFVVNDVGNSNPWDAGYCPTDFVQRGHTCAFADAATYVNSVTGHVISFPIAQMLPDASNITDWSNFSQYVFQFDYLDSLIEMALQNGKTFSVNLAVGYQSLPNLNGNGPAYWFSLPTNFERQCNDGGAMTTCAPLFHWWHNDSCLSNYIPLASHPNVQQFWAQMAHGLKQHLKQTPDAGRRYYESLVAVGLPGLSKYDEEMGLPTAAAAPDASSGATLCLPDPDGATWDAGYVINENAYDAAYHAVGLGTTWDGGSLISGITNIAASFATEFPDRIITITLIKPSRTSVTTFEDFPDLIDPTPATEAGVGHFIEQAIGSIVDAGVPPSRILLMSYDLGNSGLQSTGFVLPEVQLLANEYPYSLLGWSSTFPLVTGYQTNNQGSPGDGGPNSGNNNTFLLGSFVGAQCNGGTCLDYDGGSKVDATYYQLMLDGLKPGPAYQYQVLPADLDNDPYVRSIEAGAPQYGP